jgi:hypothetical protein
MVTGLVHSWEKLKPTKSGSLVAERYSRASVTKPRYKLIAIAGIAKEMQRRLGRQWRVEEPNGQVDWCGSGRIGKILRYWNIVLVMGVRQRKKSISMS